MYKLMDVKVDWFQKEQARRRMSKCDVFLVPVHQSQILDCVRVWHDERPRAWWASCIVLVFMSTVKYLSLKQENKQCPSYDPCLTPPSLLSTLSTRTGCRHILSSSIVYPIKMVLRPRPKRAVSISSVDSPPRGPGESGRSSSPSPPRAPASGPSKPLTGSSQGNRVKPISHKKASSGASSDSEWDSSNLGALSKKTCTPEFLLKLYRILQQEDGNIICWDNGKLWSISFINGCWWG